MEEEREALGSVWILDQQHFGIGTNAKEALAKRLCIRNAYI